MEKTTTLLGSVRDARSQANSYPQNWLYKQTDSEKQNLPEQKHTGRIVCGNRYQDCCCCLVTQPCLTLCNPMDAGLPYPSPSPQACSNSCPLSQWSHPTISSSFVPFSSGLQSFPADAGSFQMSQFFETGGQSIGISASASVNENIPSKHTILN